MVEWIDETIRALGKKLPDAFEKKEPPAFPPKPKIEEIEIKEFPSLSDKTIDPENPILEESDEELESEMNRLGTDALAWYQPFHFYDKWWGIYIRQRGIVEVARFLGKRLGWKGMVQVAEKILRYHETFHFLSEWSATFLELYSEKPKYKIYAKHAAQNSNYELEELLANAYTYHCIEPPEVREKVKELFSKQPEGYRDFDLVELKPHYYPIGKRLLGETINSGSRGSSRCSLLVTLFEEPSEFADKPAFECLFDESDKAIINKVPTYLVIEPKHTSSLRFRKVYAGVEVEAHSGDHLPPHLHVWIPPESKNFKKIIYPEENFRIQETKKLVFKPYKGYPPLTNKERKKLIEFLEFDDYRERIERELREVIAPN